MATCSLRNALISVPSIIIIIFITCSWGNALRSELRSLTAVRLRRSDTRLHWIPAARRPVISRFSASRHIRWWLGLRLPLRRSLRQPLLESSAEAAPGSSCPALQSQAMMRLRLKKKKNSEWDRVQHQHWLSWAVLIVAIENLTKYFFANSDLIRWVHEPVGEGGGWLHYWSKNSGTLGPNIRTVGWKDQTLNNTNENVTQSQFSHTHNR